MTMKILLEVDIATGRVLVDNLADHYTREAMGEGRPVPVWHNNPAMMESPPVVVSQREEILRNRICAFNKTRRKNSTSWNVDNLLSLALLMDQEKCFHRVAEILETSVVSCRGMYNSMKNAGVV